MNSVLANLNARAVIADAMAPEVVDRGPFGSGQNPFEKKRNPSATPTGSVVGPSSRGGTQVRLVSAPPPLRLSQADRPSHMQFSTVIDPVMVTMSNLLRNSSVTLEGKTEEDRISWT